MGYGTKYGLQYGWDIEQPLSSSVNTVVGSSTLIGVGIVTAIGNVVPMHGSSTLIGIGIIVAAGDVITPTSGRWQRSRRRRLRSQGLI